MDTHGFAGAPAGQGDLPIRLGPERFTVLLVGILLGAAPGAAAGGGAARGERCGYSVLEVQVLSVAGKTVPGARVWAKEREDRPGFDRLSSSGVTDGDGVAVLVRLRPSHRYRVTAFHPAIAAVSRNDVPVPPGRSRLVLRAEQGYAITGRVIGLTGKPRAGVTVTLRPPGRSPVPFEPPGMPSSVTDPEGRFRLGRVGSGVWGIVARAPRRVAWRGGVRAGSTGVTMRLKRARDLLATGICEVLRGSEATLRGLDAPFILKGRVDRRGTLRIPGVPAGRFRLAFAASHVSVPEIDVGDDDPPSIRVNVPSVPPAPRIEVSGRVVGADGSPAAHATVGLYVDAGGKGFLSLVSGVERADEAGGFVLRAYSHLARFDFRVLARLNGMAGASPLCRAGGKTLCILDHKALGLAVRVLETGSDRPLPGCSVRVLSLLPETSDARTGTDGRIPPLRGLLPFDLLGNARSFHGIRGLSPPWTRKLPGVVEVRVSRAPWHLPANRILIAGSEPELVVRLTRAPVFEGKVVDRKGRPAAAIRIRTGDGAADADTDDQGRFVLIGSRKPMDLSHLFWSPVPDWGPVARLPELEPTGEKGVFRIPDARRLPLELTFPPRYEGCSVLLTTPDAAPPSAGPTPQGVIDSRGRCTPGRFLSGRYRVRLLARGRIVSEAELVLEEDPPREGWRKTVTLPEKR